MQENTYTIVKMIDANRSQQVIIGTYIVLLLNKFTFNSFFVRNLPARARTSTLLIVTVQCDSAHPARASYHWSIVHGERKDHVGSNSNEFRCAKCNTNNKGNVDNPITRIRSMSQLLDCTLACRRHL